MEDRYKATIKTWNKLASAYQERFMDLDLYNDTYDLFCGLMPTGAQVFEIGCGPGNITRYLVAERPDLDITAIDAAPDMIRLAKANNPGVDFKIMDGRAIGDLTATYNGVICGFCLPYLSSEDCAKLVKDSAGLLCPGGIIYLSLLEGNYSSSGYETGSTGDPVFVYYHEEAYLQKCFAENGFEVLHTIRKNYTKSDGSSQVHLVMIAKKTA